MKKKTETISANMSERFPLRIHKKLFEEYEKKSVNETQKKYLKESQREFLQDFQNDLQEKWFREILKYQVKGQVPIPDICFLITELLCVSNS